MFRMLGFARVVVLAAVVTAGVLGPRVSEACSPPAPSARLVAPANGELVPTNAVFWFSFIGILGMGRLTDLEIEIIGPEGPPVSIPYSGVAEPSSPRGVAQRVHTLRAEAHLEPNTAYSLSYNSATSATVGGGLVRTTFDFVTASSPEVEPPASPTAELAFAARDSEDPWPFVCSAGEFDEVTIIFANAPRAAGIHARTRYDDVLQFSLPITHVVEPGTSGATIFAWAVDRGLPCVELIAEGQGGALSAPTVVCEAMACAEGAGWDEGLKEDAAWWRARHGPASCDGVDTAVDGCTCMVVPEGDASGLGVIAGLIGVAALLRRRPRTVVGALVS